MFNRFRSFIAALRASAAVGKASKLERQGHLPEAIQAARLGLSELRNPYVNRFSAPEGAALSSLTTILERLAHQTSSPGAEMADLKDSLEFLKALNSTEPIENGDLRSWIPYLEAKLSKEANHASGNASTIQNP